MDPDQSLGRLIRSDEKAKTTFTICRDISRNRSSASGCHQESDASHHENDVSRQENDDDSDEIYQDDSASSDQLHVHVQRPSRMSFSWNRKFENLDIVKRRRSIGDPQELQRMSDFDTRRESGESDEFTSAWNTHLKSSVKHTSFLSRCHTSPENMKDLQRDRITSRQSYGNFMRKDFDDDPHSFDDSGFGKEDSTLGDTDDASASSYLSSEDSAPESPMIYRVSVKHVTTHETDFEGLKAKAKSIIIEPDNLDGFIYSIQTAKTSHTGSSARGSRSSNGRYDPTCVEEDDDEKDANWSFPTWPSRWYQVFSEIHHSLREMCVVL